MSWAAHDLEPYVIQKHLGRRIAFVPLLLGSYAPDLASKWFVYGIDFFGIEIKADNPAQFHRGWPGVGFTHSLLFGVVLGAVVYAVSRNRKWAVSILIGQWAHALTDIGDTVGTMLFFPFSTHLFSVGAWAYAGQTGRWTDAGAYYSGIGFVWDGVFVVWGLLCWRVLTTGYFRETIVAADPFWRWAGRYLPETALITLYRASFFYGICRWAAWLIWAHLVRSYSFDVTWGGPHWVDAVHSSDLNSAACCPCPGCSGGSSRLALYGAIAVVARLRGATMPALREPDRDVSRRSPRLRGRRAGTRAPPRP
jgi:membrane-bound metal-dependent hydrolase YbcI (DUF457 family)